MHNKLVVISMDAMVQQDLAVMKDMPAVHYIMEHGSYVKDFRSIYPTVTYPCHTTMSTGCYPNKHGITSNEQIILEEGKNPITRWHRLHQDVKCEDIIDVCKKAGYTTSIIGWPISGNHPNVDYLVNETWPENKEEDSPEDWEKAYLASGTPQWLYDEIVRDKIWMRRGRKQPSSSYFLVRIACDIIRKYTPDIMIIHVGNLDHFRHTTGVFSATTKRSLSDTDSMIRMLFEATKDAGTFEHTNFVVTSDHGQMTCSRMAYPNVFLKEKGFISTDKDGNITDWKALALGEGMGVQVYVKDPSCKEDLYKVLTEAAESNMHGFEKVYTVQETNDAEKLSGAFEFVLETDGYTKFGFNWNGKEIESLPMGLYEAERGGHGFHPDKGPRPVFLAVGPDIYEKRVIEHAKLVDGAPTYAKIMGVSLNNADGHSIDIVKKES